MGQHEELTSDDRTGEQPAQDRGWPAYVAAFHAEHTGITEGVLENALDAQARTPYDWLAQALSAMAPVRPLGAAERTVLDLACGSGPMAPGLVEWRYLGADLSMPELREARTRGRPVVQADASRLPLPHASMDAVVMSMALMLVPLQATLDEVRRVLRPGGVFAATVPHHRPMAVRDRLRYARLYRALRQPGLSYPNDASLRDAQAAFRAADLVLHVDTEVAFAYDLATKEAAQQLLASLYLPAVESGGITAGTRVVRRWVGSTITLPLRLLVATAPQP